MKKLFIIVCSLFVGIANADNVITSKEYVDTQGATLQPEISAKNANTVLTYPAAGTDAPGEKAIYDASAAYGAQTDALVTAGQFNNALQTALDTEFVCVSRNDQGCLLYEIRAGTPKSASKNLFDKNNRERLYGWFPGTGAPLQYVPSGYANRIACKPNTTYTASYHGNSDQAVLNFASTYSDAIPSPSVYSIPCPNSIRLEHPTNNTPVTITTGPNDKWLIVQYNVAEPQNTDMADYLQIEEGSVATAYEPYQYQNLYLPAEN